MREGARTFLHEEGNTVDYTKMQSRQQPECWLYCRADLRRRGIKFSNSSLLRHEKAGTFPERIRLGDHSVAWVASEIDAHLQKLAADREICR